MTECCFTGWMHRINSAYFRQSVSSVFHTCRSNGPELVRIKGLQKRSKTLVGSKKEDLTIDPSR